MATQVFYQTASGVGVDPTNYQAVSASATPEYPAPSFLTGTRAFGSDGSEFVFVQASTTINPTDFVAINLGSLSQGNYQANSLTNTNVASSLMVGVGSTGLIVKGSVSYIPAQAYFWACTKGQNIPATSSGAGLATNASPVALFTSATAGVITSVTTSSTLATGFAGIVCVNSLTVSIPASIVPPAGVLTSTGFTQGPVVNLNQPRFVQVFTTADGMLSKVNYGY